MVACAVVVNFVAEQALSAKRRHAAAPVRSGNQTSPPAAPKSLVGSWPFQVLAIVAVGLAAYANSFSVPFQWDDELFIANNPLLTDLSYFFTRSSAEVPFLHRSLVRRYVTFLSFAIDRRVHGLDVVGYHVFNLAVHLGNALLVYCLAVVLFRTPVLAGSALASRRRTIALAAALLFVAHPIQTMAVTYIYQRLASLAALFFLGSLLSYLLSRLSADRVRAALLLGLSLLCAVAAMKSKENAATLPLVVLLLEICFLQGRWLRRLLWCAPLLLTLAVVPLTLLSLRQTPGSAVARLWQVTQVTQRFDRFDYLVTQPRVIASYLRLLALPVGQSLMYDVELSHTLLDWRVVTTSLLLLALGLVAGWCYWVSRSRRSELRLIAFAIAWFLVTISLESSVVTLDWILQEYRVYLPSVGALLATATLWIMLRARLAGRRLDLALQAIGLAVVAALAVATSTRNQLWQDRTALWEEAVARAPQTAVARYNLGNQYLAGHRTAAAIEQYRAAIAADPDYFYPYVNLGNLLWLQGQRDESLSLFEEALRRKPDLVLALLNLGAIYRDAGQYARAQELLQRAVTADPEHVEVRRALATVYEASRQPALALEQYRTVLRLKPNDAAAQQQLDRLLREPSTPSGGAVPALH